METPQPPSTRKKFLLWSLATLGAATLMKFIRAEKQKPTEIGQKSDTIKMLTQDGKLVEIDRKLLASADKKISTDELKQWIKKQS